MKRLDLSASARADLAAIWRFTEQRWGQAQAQHYGDRINEALATLAAGQARSDRAGVGRYRSLRVASHLIFFREEERVLQVVRILHVRMDAPRHLPG